MWNSNEHTLIDAEGLLVPTERHVQLLYNDFFDAGVNVLGKLWWWTKASFWLFLGSDVYAIKRLKH